MKIAKCRTTNYRAVTATAAGARQSVERRGATTGGSMSGLDHLSASQAADAANADAWVSGYSDTVLRGIARDLGKELSFDRKDPVQRWKMARKAAVGRRLTNTPTSRQ